ncbi:unnamed protein product [Amoebophrya sp. A25]|nr:unnamed protein product [Amoebophrya sp. A25]|eukprot:GSA25T00022064001.1
MNVWQTKYENAMHCTNSPCIFTLSYLVPSNVCFLYYHIRQLQRSYQCKSRYTIFNNQRRNIIVVTSPSKLITSTRLFIFTTIIRIRIRLPFHYLHKHTHIILLLQKTVNYT